MTSKVQSQVVGLEDSVITALAKHTGADAAVIDVSGPLAAIPGIESVKLVRAVADIEDRWGVMIPATFAFETATVDSFINCVADLVGASGAA
jgi:hypothetical protein